MKKIIENNEFGIKRTDNRLCLLCKKYIPIKGWKKHKIICEKEFKQKNGI